SFIIILYSILFNISNVYILTIVNGTTGEGLSLSIQERKQLAEEWVTQGKDKLDHIIIHVGTLSLPESKDLAKHAAQIGADGISVISPFFFKEVNKDELVAFFRDVASEAPNIPFYYYHIPPITGIKIRAEELLDSMKEQIPTFKGVKFSDRDLLDLRQCVQKSEQDSFMFLYGVDEQLLSSLVIGANGAVGRSKQEFCIQEFLGFLISLGFGVPHIKAVMTIFSGIPMGPPRLPLSPVSDDFIFKVKTKLESLKNCLFCSV
ncbi:hypothetical protein Chor_003357, partial [Crotalus horridus]